MTISFICVCNTPYTAQDSQAGQQFTCPTCRQAVVIPATPGPAALQATEQQQGWAGKFFAGESPAPQSKGAQMLAELEANSDEAMDDVLLGRVKKPPQAPAQAAPGHFGGSHAPLAPTGVDPEMQLLPDSDIAKVQTPSSANLDAALDEVANMFAQAPPEPLKKTKQKNQRSSERQSKPRQSSIERRRRGSSAEKSRRGASAERSRRGASAERSRRGASAEKPRRGASAERSRRGASAEKSRRERRRSSSEEVRASASNRHIVNCIVCDEQISRKARECPYCQAPVPKALGFAKKNEQSLQYIKLAGGIVVLLIILGVAVKMMSKSGNRGKRDRRRKATIDIDGHDSEQASAEKDPGKDPGKDPEKDPGKDPEKDPGKDPGKKPLVAPKKNPADPLAVYKGDLKSLRQARDAAEIEQEIAKLSKNPQAKDICKTVIGLEKDSVLAGYCHRVLYSITKDKERDERIRIGLNSNALDAVYAAVDIVLKEDKSTLKKSFEIRRHSTVLGRRFGALYAYALLNKKNGPNAKDLPFSALVMDGVSVQVRCRMAVLRLLCGDGLVMEQALKAFDIKNRLLRQAVQRAFEQYSGKTNISLTDPSSDNACRAAQSAWAAWYEAYKPVQKALAYACSDPERAPGTGKERDQLMSKTRAQRHKGINRLLALKDKALISYMKTFAAAEASAKTANGIRTLGALIEQVASKEDIPALLSWLDDIAVRGSQALAAAALTVAGKEAAPAVLRMLERKVLTAQEVAQVLPDFKSAKGPELDALETFIDEYKDKSVQKAEPYWLILASLGSTKVEEFLSSKKRNEQIVHGVLRRYQNRKYEKKLFDAASNKIKLPNIDSGQAARYLIAGGKAFSAKSALKALKDPASATLGAKLLVALASPKHKKQLFEGIKSSHSNVAIACVRTLADMQLTDSSSTSKFAALYNKSNCPYYLKAHLKNALISLCVKGKRQPHQEIVAQAEQWRVDLQRWEEKKIGSPPKLRVDVIKGLGRVGDTKRDSKFLLDALITTQNPADKAQILISLGHLKSKAGAFTMKGYLLPNVRGRGIAGLALAQLKDKTALRELRMVVTESKNLREEDGQILMAMSIIDPSEAWKTYKVIKGKNIKISAAAMPGVAFALVRDPDADGVDELQQFSTHPNPAVRAKMSYGVALAQTYKKDEVVPGMDEILGPLLFDESEIVRINTLLAGLTLQWSIAPHHLYPILRSKAQHLRTVRRDAWNEFLAPQFSSENFESWIHRLANKNAGFRTYLSGGCKREILHSFRKAKKR
jgi:hypothetical protein